MSRLRCRHLLVLVSLVSFAAGAPAQQRPERISDLLEEKRGFAVRGDRSKVVKEVLRLEERRKAAAVARARQAGLPIRVQGPGNRVAELMAFQDDRPLYAVTYNREAAITSAANRTRALLAVDGTGFTVGIWDAGAVRATHEAFAGRLAVQDNASQDTHATHVGGTIAAAGPNTRAHGMSPNAFLDSYDWNYDRSEMTARGASYPGEPGTIYISNHSYGFSSGWSPTGTFQPQWEWLGLGTTDAGTEDNFGKYSAYASEIDEIAYNLPYYLSFWAAGNDRNDDPPAGSSVRIGSTTASYNDAIHPPGDGFYRGGYDTIGFESVAKNVVTVGAVSDAASVGQRDLSKALMASYSAWGPTDDGRIKPDIVANGSSLYSTSAASDSSYGSNSGTSMATPNASGSAQLLVSYFAQRFPGHALRASTLKGLILHTADDLGPPGPDYSFGWGLMNTKAAADQIAAHHASPGSHRIVEGELISGDSVSASDNYTFTWDGFSPIRATLCWTDPAGPATNNHDNRASRLVNDLDLHIVGPEGSSFQPYVMPFVGNWSESLLSAPATTGKNSTDNTEQVFIASPPAPGVYTIAITTGGPLADGAQHYSLILSGSAATEAPAPTVTALSPDHAASDLTTLTIEGDGFQTGASVTLRFPGEADRPAFSHEITPDRITARIDTETMAGGFWDLVVTNPDGQTALLPSSFAVAGPIWSADFESPPTGWSSSADTGSTTWTLWENESHSPTHAFHAPGPAGRTIITLHSPGIEIPAGASNLIFGFWHTYDFSANDGGVIEFSLDGGEWFDPTAAGSGTTVTSGAYNGFLSDSGNPNSRNPLGAREAWTGETAGFTEVSLALDASLFAGHGLHVRWQLGANNQTASPGWTIDDVTLRGSGIAFFPTFVDWQEKHFTADELSDSGISGANADPDGDDVSNLLEYALGGDPRAPGRDHLPQISFEDISEDLFLVLTFARPVGRTDLYYSVQTSSDLHEWTDIAAETWERVSDGERETITVRQPVSDGDLRFLRLQVEERSD